MQGADSADVPDPTGALYMPTSRISRSNDDQTMQSYSHLSSRTTQFTTRASSEATQSSNLAWSQDEHIVEPELFEEEELTAQINERRSSFDWARWIALLVLVLVAGVAAIAMFSVVFPGISIDTAPRAEHSTPATHLPHNEPPSP